MGRPLEECERVVLMKVLDGAAFDGAAELREQVGMAKVVRAEPTWLYFEVGEGASAVTTLNGPIPVTALVNDIDGAAVGELLVWTTKGRLSALEFAWVTDEMPSSLPDPDAIDVRAAQAE
jgi:hypothetical protein